MTWRQHCTPIIAQIIAQNPDLSEKELRKVISAAYPYGQRAMHPYKVWCSEVNKQVKKHFLKNDNAVQIGLFANLK